jgi:hypothetical protein
VSLFWPNRSGSKRKNYDLEVKKISLALENVIIPNPATPALLGTTSLV